MHGHSYYNSQYNFCCHYDRCDPIHLLIRPRLPWSSSSGEPQSHWPSCLPPPILPTHHPLQDLWGEDRTGTLMWSHLLLNKRREGAIMSVVQTCCVCVVHQPAAVCCSLLQFIPCYNTVYSEHILMYNTSVWKCTRCKSMQWGDSDVAWRDLMNG